MVGKVLVIVCRTDARWTIRNGHIPFLNGTRPNTYIPTAFWATVGLNNIQIPPPRQGVKTFGKIVKELPIFWKDRQTITISTNMFIKIKIFDKTRQAFYIAFFRKYTNYPTSASKSTPPTEASCVFLRRCEKTKKNDERRATRHNQANKEITFVFQFILLFSPGRCRSSLRCRNN